MNFEQPPLEQNRAILDIAPAGDTARLTWELVRKHRGQLVLTVVAFLGVGAASLVGPWALGRIVDAVRDGTGVLGYAIAVAGAALAGGVLTAISTAALSRATAPALAELREDVLDDGRVVEQGSHAELVAAGGVYARLWAVWCQEAVGTAEGRSRRTSSVTRSMNGSSTIV